MLKTINVKYELFKDAYPSLDEVSERLDSYGPGNLINRINWIEFNYRPGVRFNIAYSDREIYLKYYVTEDFFKAEKTETNQMVCEDSCVEFFVSPAGDGLYYNFEFNAIGTCLLGSGHGRNDSSLAPGELVSKIRRLPSSEIRVHSEKKGMIGWTLTLAIPLEVFVHHKIGSLKGKTFRANFYKCGDKLSVPHYLSWSPVGTAHPDFHRPEYFGKLHFS